MCGSSAASVVRHAYQTSFELTRTTSAAPPDAAIDVYKVKASPVMVGAKTRTAAGRATVALGEPCGWRCVRVSKAGAADRRMQRPGRTLAIASLLKRVSIQSLEDDVWSRSSRDFAEAHLDERDIDREFFTDGWVFSTALRNTRTRRRPARSTQ